MNVKCKRQSAECEAAGRRGYLLTEALVYIGLVFVVLGVGYVAMYHCIDNSVIMSRNADDIVRALNTGERWRADIRAAAQSILLETDQNEPTLHLRGATNQVDYRCAGATLYRRVNSGTWVPLLDNVKASTMQPDSRPAVAAWRWELELQPRARGSLKASRVRPLFTFLAVAQTPVKR
ncbi:MAG TPA: hypothetical protein VN578_25410 [Candidatus Binatia bacterium]|jgi:hypothetical protein|nr:hypothetical protein [Candidatus Binatia bacterium]